MKPGRIEDLVTVAGLVRDGRATSRGAIGKIMGLRSTTVSELVGRLVASDVLLESAVRQRGPGRPAAALSFNRRRLGAIFVTVIDQALVASAVDLGLHVLGRASTAPPRDADNAVIARRLLDLVRDCAREFPPDIEICAVVCSLSGLLDVQKFTWCVASRWPEMRNLDVRAALAEFGADLFLIRNLDAEIAGVRLHERHGEEEATLLLHWGYGIGASYASAGEAVNRNRGRFCEIGHWGLGNGAGRRCTCGNRDCLETVAALWSLWPELKRDFPELSPGENEIAAHIGGIDLAESPPLDAALNEMLRVTTNLCRLLFPDRVVLTGPFVRNPHIFTRFAQTLEEAPMLRSLDKIRVSVSDGGQTLEMQGALREPFEAGLRALLSRGTGQGWR